MFPTKGLGTVMIPFPLTVVLLDYGCSGGLDALVQTFLPSARDTYSDDSKQNETRIALKNAPRRRPTSAATRPLGSVNAVIL